MQNTLGGRCESCLSRAKTEQRSISRAEVAEETIASFPRVTQTVMYTNEQQSQYSRIRENLRQMQLARLKAMVSIDEAFNKRLMLSPAKHTVGLQCTCT